VAAYKVLANRLLLIYWVLLMPICLKDSNIYVKILWCIMLIMTMFAHYW